MGVLFKKRACTINENILEQNLNEIKANHQGLTFIVTDRIEPRYHDSFLRHHEEVRNHLQQTYEEEIEPFTQVNLQTIWEGENTISKRFALIVKGNEVLGKQDATIINKTVRLETLYLDPQLRGNGFGKWLAGSVMLSCKLDFSEINLFETNVDEKNISTLKTLKPFGFVYETPIDYFIDKNIK